jgi:hypothetical protein
MLPLGGLHVKHGVQRGYQLSICSGTTENYRKPWSSWPVAGPSGCKLTSSQQSDIRYASANISPCLSCCFFPIFLFSHELFFTNSFMCVFWIRTNLCITPIVYCSLEKSNVIQGLLLIQWQRLWFTAKIRLASWIVTFTMNTAAKLVLSCLFTIKTLITSLHSTSLLLFVCCI